ncbi:MAG: RNA 3'-terminal phosphate cyclase [Gemmataceae bacterium]|nr:RNA 3'-terminal phosphate cyclase [Gemmataceae bacterium]
MSLIEIDGSQGEGGGQIVRSALALSLLTGRPFKLVNIRAGRRKPGLQPQHMACVRAAAAIGNARYQGGEVGSATLLFEPREVRPGTYRWDIGTAGATTLVLQTVYLPLMLRAGAASEIVIVGGTHVPRAPCAHFLQTTWAGYLRRVGLDLLIELRRPGFYPRGGGEIRAILHPANGVQPLHLLECPPLRSASVLSACARLPITVAQRQANRLIQRLQTAGVEVASQVEHWQALSPGSVAAVTFDHAPIPTLFAALGERGKPAETVADEAADEALAFRDTQAPVDPHSADQLLLPLAFCSQPSAFRTSCITSHLTTNAAVIQTFLPVTIEVQASQGAAGIVRISGVL